MRHRLSRALGALAFLITVGGGACSAAGPNGAGSVSQRHPIVVALLPGAPPATPGSALTRYLEAALARPVQLRAEATYAALAADLNAARADLAFTSDVGYLALSRAAHVRVVAQAAAKTPTNPGIVCNASAGVKPLKDGGDWSSLRGRSILFGPEGSLASNVWPRYFIGRSGVDPIGDLGDIRVVANEREAILDVYNGIADCAATAGDDRSQVADVAPDVTDRVALIYSAPAPVPPPPLVARGDLSAGDAGAVEKALAGVAKAADAAAELAAITGAPGARPARDADYALLRMAVTTVDPALVTRTA